MKMIVIEITEKEDGELSMKFNNLSREDVTEKEENFSKLIEKLNLNILKAIDNPEDTAIKSWKIITGAK